MRAACAAYGSSRLGHASGWILEKKKLFLAQRRKGAKKTLETRQRFAPLRLCGRNLLRERLNSLTIPLSNSTCDQNLIILRRRALLLFQLSSKRLFPLLHIILVACGIDKGCRNSCLKLFIFRFEIEVTPVRTEEIVARQ